jgi:hypothetical protein
VEKRVGSADGIQYNWTVHTTSTFQQNAKSVSAAGNLRAGIDPVEESSPYIEILTRRDTLTSQASQLGKVDPRGPSWRPLARWRGRS